MGGMKDSISLINDAGRICNCEEINEAVNMQINGFSPSVGNDYCKITFCSIPIYLQYVFVVASASVNMSYSTIFAQILHDRQQLLRENFLFNPTFKISAISALKCRCQTLKHIFFPLSLFAVKGPLCQYNSHNVALNFNSILKFKGPVLTPIASNISNCCCSLF